MKREQIALGMVLGAGLLLFFASQVSLEASAFAGTRMWVLVPVAFLAGVLSFLSPCTLPILPAYFAFSLQTRQTSVTVTTLCFMGGLATTLTLLGASATAVGQLLARHLQTITLIGSVAIISFGLASLFGKGFSGFQFGARPAATWLGSYFYGATFALGWSACIGPILGAIFTLLATQNASIAQGAGLMFVYALGLGSPLVIIATFFTRLGNGTKFWGWIRGKGFMILGYEFHSTNVLSGLLLIGLGILLVSGQLSQLTIAAANSPLSLWVIEAEESLRILFRLQ